MHLLSSLNFTQATYADIPALIELVTSAYRGELSRAGWTTEADILDGQRIDDQGIKEELDRPRSVIIMAQANHQLLACCHISDENGKGYFGMFAVRPNQQGKGIGKHVMRYAEDYVLKQWKLPTLQMSVIDCRSELIAFYERRGYMRTGIKKPFPYGDERFGVPRSNHLQFEVLRKRLLSE